MTIKFDELKTQDDLDKAVAAVVKGEVDGLKKKNDELMEKYQDVNKKLKPFEGLDAEEIKKVLKSAKDAKDKKDKDEGNWEKVVADMKAAHETEIAKRDDQQKQWQLELDKNLKAAAVRDAIVEAKIAAPFIKAVTPMLETQMVVVGEGDKRRALIGDKTATEFLSAFVATDEGKHYVSADNNSGGGAGGSGVTGYKGPNPFDPKTVNITEQMKLVKENPKLADQLRAKVAAR